METSASFERLSGRVRSPAEVLNLSEGAEGPENAETENQYYFIFTIVHAGVKKNLSNEHIPSSFVTFLVAFIPGAPASPSSHEHPDCPFRSPPGLPLPFSFSSRTDKRTNMSSRTRPHGTEPSMCLQHLLLLWFGFRFHLGFGLTPRRRRDRRETPGVISRSAA